MVKWQRRLWIAGVGLGTTLLIFLGLVVGSFRIAVQLVPDYRADVESRVAKLLRTPARIEQMNLIWRGRYPTLQLNQVELGVEAQGLHFDELRIGFSLIRLLQGDLTPRRVQLSGTAVQLKLQDGQLQLEGLNAEGGAGQAPQELLDRLYQIGQIELTDARLLWLDLDHQLPPRELRIREFEARRSFGDLKVHAVANLTGQGQIQAEAVLQSRPEWQIQQLNADLKNMNLWADVQAHFPQLPALKGRVDHMAVDVRWQDGEWQSADLAFDLREFAPAAAAYGFSHWQGQLLLSAAGPGVRAELQNEALVARSGRWPENLATFEWQPGSAPRGQISFSAGYLRLDDLLPWTALLPEQQRQQLQQLQAAGEARDLVLQLDDGASWPRLTVELEQVQVAAWQKVPGVRGFSGSLSMNADGGRVLVDSRDLIIDVPEIFDEPLPLDELSGNLSWQRSAEGWQISAPGLHYAALNLDGVGRLVLNLGERPDIDLELNFFCTDPLPWLDYQPRFWGRHLKDWLAGAVQGGNVSSGEVVIRGALDEFPFRDGAAGEFKVALDIEDAGLKFAPDWPAVSIGRAELLIAGDSLDVEAFDNRIGELNAEQAHARFDDLRDAELVVEAGVQGDAKDIWAMLGRSDLRRTLGPTLDALDLSGRTEGDLRLVLPLRDLRQTDYEITARLDRAALWTRYWPDPVKKIRGELRIDRQGLRSHNLTATVGGLPVTAQLLPDDGLTTIEAELEASIAELPDSVPIGDWLRSRAKGASRWQFSMQVGHNANHRLRFESNLLGTALDLPAPYGKQADELRRLTVDIVPEDDVRLHVTYGQLLGLDGLIVAGEGLRAARLNFGTEILQAGAPGWWVEGHMPRASLAQWLPLITDLSAELSQLPSGGQGFGGLVVRVAELQALGQELGDTRLQLTQSDTSWDLKLASPRANGTIRIPQAQPGGRLQLNAQFSRLNWALGGDNGGATIDPREMPELHLRAENFSLNEAALGRLALDLTPVSRGTRIERLNVYENERESVDVQGLWVRDDVGESAALEIGIDTRSFSAWLSALGYRDNIVARRGRVEGQLNWAPNPEGLSLSHLNGELNFTFSEGQLLNVEPGAGRVLGLFSINALPRRFFLDFSDVVDSGLGFDRMGGTFSLSNGVADTDDFEMEGPSLRIIARGEVDLARRLYDQTITIYPGLSSGVSLAATLLGGPVVGIFTLLAQELLDKPLDQVTQISYHLGGSWDSPEVSRNP